MVHNVKKTTTNTFIQCTDIWKMYQYRRIICTHPETRVANTFDLRYKHNLAISGVCSCFQENDFVSWRLSCDRGVVLDTNKSFPRATNAKFREVGERIMDVGSIFNLHRSI